MPGRSPHLNRFLDDLFGFNELDRRDGYHRLLASMREALGESLARDVYAPLAGHPQAEQMVLATLQAVFPDGSLSGFPLTKENKGPFPGGFCVRGEVIDSPFERPRRVFLTPAAVEVQFRLSANASEAAARRGRRTLVVEAVDLDVASGLYTVLFTWDAPVAGGRKVNLERLIDQVAEDANIRKAFDGVATTRTREILGQHLSGFEAQLRAPRFVRTHLQSDLERAAKTAVVNGLSTGEFSLAGANEISLALGVVARIGQLLDPLTGILSDSALAAPYVRESAWLLSPSLLSDRLLERVLDCQKQVQDWKALLGPEVMDSVTHPEDLRSRPGMLVRTDLLEPELAKEILALAPALHSVMEGVLVHGDNLGALRLMTPTMRERVHVSYIDPPYNTGNASVYIYADSRERSAWAAQIHSRLTHARRLLREDGVLWSSIDDNEAHTLRFLLDSTMGAEQFISTISWRKKVVRGRGAQHVLPQTEYVHAYGKNAKELPAFFEPLTDEMIKAYRWEDEQGPYKRIPLAKTGTSQSPRPNLVYPIEAPDGSMIPCPTHQWRWSKQTLRDRFDEIEFVQKRDGGWTIFTKQRLYVDGEQRRRTPCSYYDRVTTTDGTREIKELFGSVVADFPKPTRLLRDLLSWPGQPSTGEDVAYYLDFFAGSGSTAHAVMEENRSDDVQRRSLMIEAGFHFDTVLLPRIQKLAYSMEWKKGRPGVVSERETAFQVLRLACFDDVLERQVQIYLGESVDGLSVNELETGLWNLGVHTEHRLRVEGVDIVLGRNQNGDAVAVLWSDSVVAASSVAAAARIAKSKGAMEIFPHASLSIPRSLHGKCHVWNADTRVDNVDSPVGTRSIPAIA